MGRGVMTLVGMASTCIMITACGGNGVTIPTIAPTATINAASTATRTAELAQLATAQAPTATPQPTATATPLPPTATPAPTATRAPTATATQAISTPTTAAPARAGGTATSRPSTSATASSSSSRVPSGAAPAGWKTYTGPARIPFAIYYPPDWKVDESAVTSDGRVAFQSPTIGVSFTMQASTEKTTISIDTLRDAQAKGIASTCKASGVEGTDSETYSGVVFDELVQTCDFGRPPLFVFGIAAGLNNGYPWTFFLSSPYDSYQVSVDKFFQPMLNSLRIYANPVG